MQSVRKLFWATPLLLCACAGVDVRTDYDNAVDFSRFSTYHWQQLPETGNSLMDSRVVANVDGQLQARGWRKVPEGQAQTALAAEFTRREGQRIDTHHHGWGPAWDGWGRGGPLASMSHVVTYTVGTLILDLYDVKSRNAIWRGTASNTLSNDSGAMRRTLEAAVGQTFANFPPGVPAGARPR